ncbi:MAG: hypothetical protein CMH54_00265 [Myxococcales bacterium]|mgnify:CR=1 FL=1|nr:hypothetical protein [Myxococcales bacterium]
MRHHQNRSSTYVIVLLVIMLAACARSSTDTNCLNECFPTHNVDVDSQKLAHCRVKCLKGRSDKGYIELCQRLINAGITATTPHFDTRMTPEETLILRETATTRCLQAISNDPKLKKCLMKAQNTEEIRLCR